MSVYGNCVKVNEGFLRGRRVRIRLYLTEDRSVSCVQSEGSVGGDFQWKRRSTVMNFHV